MTAFGQERTPPSGVSNTTVTTRVEWLKEVIIATLAAVTLAALLVAYWVFASSPDGTAAEDIRTRMVNVEKVATSLFAIFAAFVGYYAGRVPAERTATVAQQAANAERVIADQKRNEAVRATALLAQARDLIAPRATAASVSNNSVLAEIDAFLRERT